MEYRPIPYRPGNKVIRVYDEDFHDGVGHYAIITKADYKDKKGRVVEGFVLFVKWRDNDG